jgi:hypothetical protein
MTVTDDDLDAAISTVVSTLRPAAGQDWSARAGTLEWDCWHTAEHIGDCLLSYAAQLVVQPAARYVRFLASAEKDALPLRCWSSPRRAGASSPRPYARHHLASGPTTRPAWPTRKASRRWDASRHCCTAST